MLWIILIGLVLILAFIAFGAFKIGAQVFLKSTCKIDDKSSIALTFDDGPHPEYTPLLLDLLKKLKIKATFFVIGKNVEMYPEMVKRMVEEGHCIGLHSYAHTYNYGFLSTKSILADLKQNMELVEKASGKRTHLFRPPFGVTNPNIAKAVRQLDLKSIGWSLRSFDTAKPQAQVLAKLKTKVKAGDIILMHDHLPSTCSTIETFVEEAQNNGLKFVNLDRL
jgi:peptidoglycan/xylan/chitin deacetylase (PgdA/CDA1 family)